MRESTQQTKLKQLTQATKSQKAMTEAESIVALRTLCATLCWVETRL